MFAGRLVPEKGIKTLLGAWNELACDLPLKILGDGPEADQVAEAAARHPNIEWLGWRPAQEVLALIGGAKCVVVPSVWYETFNRTQLEAFAEGTPVVASRLGSMQAIVEHRRTGLLFTPNDQATWSGRSVGFSALRIYMRACGWQPARSSRRTTRRRSTTSASSGSMALRTNRCSRRSGTGQMLPAVVGFGVSAISVALKSGGGAAIRTRGRREQRAGEWRNDLIRRDTK